MVTGAAGDGASANGERLPSVAGGPVPPEEALRAEEAARFAVAARFVHGAG